MNTLSANSTKVGLEINIKKTVQKRINQPNNAKLSPLLLNNEEIEVVDDFKYLGSYIGSVENDVQKRIALAWVAYWRLDSIFTSKSTSIQFKLRLFKAACVPILLYGCESWVLNKELTEKLNIFERKCYRKMLGIKQSDHHLLVS